LQLGLQEQRRYAYEDVPGYDSAVEEGHGEGEYDEDYDSDSSDRNDSFDQINISAVGIEMIP
jgi:hypothetical protein